MRDPHRPRPGGAEPLGKWIERWILQNREGGRMLDLDLRSRPRPAHFDLRSKYIDLEVEIYRPEVQVESILDLAVGT